MEAGKNQDWFSEIVPDGHTPLGRLGDCPNSCASSPTQENCYMNPNKVVLKFEQCAEQDFGAVRRIVGFVPGKSLVALIDAADLSANPRSAKTGAVTADIIDSLKTTPDLLPFKTKGMLLASSEYKTLDRNRYEFAFSDQDIEGLLDGGHNALATGIYMMQVAGVPEKTLRSIKNWSDFGPIWRENFPRVTAARDLFDFLLPVEVLVPVDGQDFETKSIFRQSLLDIASARNNNVQLTEEAKANAKGFYDEVRNALPADLAERVEWKTNDGGRIKVKDILALSWIVFPKLELPDSISVLPNQIYRNKGVCVEAFNRLMEHPSVSKQHDSYKYELKNARIHSALQIVGDLPALYDQIYVEFPEAYNASGGQFGRIGAVRMFDSAKLGEKNPKYLRVPPATPFFGRTCKYTCPDGFIVPIAYGLSALLEDGPDGMLRWKTSPSQFLSKHLKGIVEGYRLVVEMATWDPQKVGKNLNAYQFAAREFEKYLILSSGAEEARSVPTD
jgi:hypothetical protein